MEKEIKYVINKAYRVVEYDTTHFSDEIKKQSKYKNSFFECKQTALQTAIDRVIAEIDRLKKIKADLLKQIKGCACKCQD